MKDAFNRARPCLNPEVGLSKAIQLGWLRVEPRDGKTYVLKKAYKVEDQICTELAFVKSGEVDRLPPATLAQLKKRKCIAEMFVILDFTSLFVM